MNTIILYTVKAAVYLAGFYLVYFVFLSADTNYRRNRIFLISSILLSLLLPVVTLNIREENSIFYLGKTLSEVYVTAERGSVSAETGSNLHPGIMVIVYRIYIIGMLVLAFKLIVDIISLLVLIIRKRGDGEKVLRFNGFNTSGFSAMGYIFINQSLSEDESEAIITHEQNHLKHNHFFDILFLEAIKVFQWFNPVIYLINRSLRAIHEYQADAGCLREGMTVARYQNLLLSHLLRSKIFLTSNSFSNPSLIRKRMIMMSKSPTGSAASLKLLLTIPVAIIILLAISAFEINKDKLYMEEDKMPQYETSNIPLDIESPSVYHRPRTPRVEVGFIPPPPPPPSKSKIESDTKAFATVEEVEGQIPGEADIPEEVFVVVEEMPVYPGGDKALMDYIYANITYPQSAKEKGIEGRVILRFAVMANGTVDKVQVIRGIDPDLDNEARRVVTGLAKWIPGKQGGKPVNVWYSVPVTFALK